MTPGPVSTTAVFDGGPATAGAGATRPPASAATTDGDAIDGQAASPFEKILSRDHDTAQTDRAARRADDHTARTARGGQSAVPGVPVSSPEGLPPSPPGAEAPSSVAGGSSTPADGDARGSLDAGAADVTVGALGPDAESLPDPSASRAAGSDSLAGTPSDAATDSRAAGTEPGINHPVATAAPLPTAPSHDSGVPISLPPPAPGAGAAPGSGAGAAPGALGLRGAEPAGKESAGLTASSASSPGAGALRTVPFPSPATGGSAPSATTGVTVSTRGDATDAPPFADAALDTAGLAASISGVLSRASGNYSVVLTLHPPELGQVQARLSLRGDLLQVDLSPDHAAAHDALENALPDLRQHLAQEGVEVDVTLGDPGAAQQGAHQGDGASRADRGNEVDNEEVDAPLSPPAAAPAQSSGYSDRLHLVL